MINLSVHKPENQHNWKFFRSGGFDQVRIETNEDLRNLHTLDQKLWAVLSCPVNNVYFDKKTLQLLDTDSDGQIRVPEILAAVKWLDTVLSEPELIFKQKVSLSLSAINQANDEGKKLLHAIKLILVFLGKEESSELLFSDVSQMRSIYSNTIFNGDGIITETATTDESLRNMIALIVSLIGGVQDRNGMLGVDSAKIDEFYTELKNYSEWIEKAESNKSDIFVMGENTEMAFQIFKKISEKIEDYFARCRYSEFDFKLQEKLNFSVENVSFNSDELLQINSGNFESLPLSVVEPNKPLPLKNKVNPFWSGLIRDFGDHVAAPLLGQKESLTEADWYLIKEKLALYSNWQMEKSGSSVESLGIAVVRQILTENKSHQLHDLISKDLEYKLQTDAFEDVEKLVLFVQYFGELLHNFVSLSNFYTKKSKAIFQIGDLYIDGRHCELNIQVSDMTKHGSLANLSGIYLMYCNLKRRNSAETMLIASAITNGNTDNIMVGRNGIFYDRLGNDWDATVVKIIDHSISIQQAFWEPYKRVARMISNQIEKWASSKDKEIEAKSVTNVSETAAKIQQPTAAAPQAPFDIGKFVGIFAAISLAIGAIGGAIATVITGFLALVWWQMPLAMAGLLILISGPSMLLAWFKLRLRNLGPLLDANGWAVNTRAKINIVFGATLTHLSALPQGSERSLHDPFAEKKRPWKLYWFMIILVIIVITLWYHGYFEKWFGITI